MEQLRKDLDIEAELIKGHGGIYEVRVDGSVVAKKTYSGFPTPEEVVEAVKAAL